MADSGNDRRSVWMNIASMLIFGSIGIFRRYIPFSSVFLACFRGILGGCCILAFMLLKRKGLKERLPLRAVLWFAVTGAVMGANWILLFEAYDYTTVPVATLCYYMEPTIVTLLSPLLFKEALTVKKAVCSAAAVAGMVLVSGVIGGGAPGDPRGILLGLGAAVLYSTVVIMNKRTVGVDAYLKTTIQLLAAGAVMIPYLAMTGGADLRGAGALPVILLLVVGVVHTGIAYVLYFGSMDGLKAQSVAILSYIDPVSALFFSAVFLGEGLDALGIAGAVMIIGAALVSELGPGRARSLSADDRGRK